jgi:hypothetical protein
LMLEIKLETTSTCEIRSENWSADEWCMDGYEVLLFMNQAWPDHVDGHNTSRDLKILFSTRHVAMLESKYNNTL